MSPRVAVAYASMLNFAGAFISLAVAATVAKDVVDASAITDHGDLRRPGRGDRLEPGHLVLRPAVVELARADRRGRRRRRSSPPGASAIFGDGILGKVLIPAVIAPVLAFVVGGIGIVFAYRIVGRQRPGPVTRGFRYGQVLSGGLLALAHGTNDAQKTMGVITLALVANGNISSTGFEVPTWVVIASASAIALGTYIGRLADHQDDGHADHQDGRGAGLLRPGRRRRRDPRLVALRLSRSRPPR